MQPLEQIRAIAERVAASRGLTVWEIQSRREASGHVVRVFVDRPGPAKYENVSCATWSMAVIASLAITRCPPRV